jgi:hypothetical protein
MSHNIFNRQERQGRKENPLTQEKPRKYLAFLASLAVQINK